MPPQGRHANVRSHRRGGPRRRLAIAPWILIATVSVLVLAGMTGGYIYIANSGCSGQPVQAEIAAAPSISKILDKLARQWQDNEPAVNGRCSAVDIISKDSADVAQALAYDWDPRSNGPQPDVWVPESTAWVREASVAVGAERMIPDLQPSLARTPTVIAMPLPMAQALQWPNKPISWQSLVGSFGGAKISQGWAAYGHPDWGPFKVGMTDPAKSTAGLHALMAVTDANDDGEVDDSERAAVWALKQAVNRSDLYKDSTDQLFAGLSKADQTSTSAALHYVSAFPALERDVLTYNATKPKVPLAAVYPDGGSADADHPYLILNAPWKDALRQQVAKQFLSYLRGPKGRAAFLAEGFRDANRIGGKDLNQENGIMPQIQTLPRAVLEPESVKVTRETWTALARPANILLVLDVSGSMVQNEVRGTGRTRLAVAEDAAANAVDLFSGQAHLGLWEFSTALGPNGEDWKPLVSMGPLDDQLAGGTRKDALLNSIKGLQGATGTGLYNTTWAAYQEVQKHYLDGAANLVVLLTDGKDEDNAGGITLDQLATKLKAGNAGGKQVNVVTIGYGPDSDFAALQKISLASGGKALQSRTAYDINTVMLTALLG